MKIIVFAKKNTHISLVGDGKNGRHPLIGSRRRWNTREGIVSCPTLSSSEAKNRAGAASLLLKGLVKVTHGHAGRETTRRRDNAKEPDGPRVLLRDTRRRRGRGLRGARVRPPWRRRRRALHHLRRGRTLMCHAHALPFAVQLSTQSSAQRIASSVALRYSQPTISFSRRHFGRLHLMNVLR
jgi:hypothetical protein